MLNFSLWLEEQEQEDQIRDQLATAMNMQQQKDSLEKLDIETFRDGILKALTKSKGTFLQRIPAERFMAAQEWVRSAKGQNIGNLVAILSGRESVDSAIPAKKKAPPMAPMQAPPMQQQPTPGTPPPPMVSTPMPGGTMAAPAPL
jgi:hypothetical protein